MQKTVRNIWNDIKKYKYGGAAILLYALAVHFLVGKFCPLVIVTGVPCPACGITRAFLLVINGKFIEAFHMHAIIYPLFVFGIVFFAERYVLGKRLKAAYYVLAFILAVGLGYYIYRMVYWFPKTVPLDYWKGSIMFKIAKNI